MPLLFHCDVFVPHSLRRPCFEGVLRYSAHALAESKKDRFGNVPLPVEFVAGKARLIEVELGRDQRTVVKQLWRQSLDGHRDLVLAIQRDGFVRTVWVNLKSDQHRTLNRGRYVKA